MMELLRRLVVLGGLLAGLFTYYVTPPALLKLEPVNFAQRYDREYRQRREAGATSPGVIEQGRALIAELTDPGSVDAYAARTLENRLLRVDGAAWESAIQGLGRSGAVYMRTTDAPFASLVPELVRRRGTTGWTNAFLALGSGASTRYVEIAYLDEPATTSAAPAALVHPMRRSSWRWALGALAAYLLLPWRRRSPDRVAMDRLSAVLAIDVMGTAIATVFFAIPLAIAGSTAAAFGEDLGGTLLLWALSLVGVGLTVWAAHNAARTIVIEPDALRVTSLAGATRFAFGEMQSVQPLAIRAMARAGVDLVMHDGRTLRLPWRGFLRFGLVLDALAGHGHPLPASEREAHVAPGLAEPGAARRTAEAPTSGRWWRPGPIAAIACVAALAAAAFWYLAPTRPGTPARDWQAEYQQSLLKTFQAAVASPSSTTTLNLDGAAFARLPDGIERLTALKTLTLNRASGLDLKAVLTQLAALPALERLELAECDLTELPAEIGGLTRLTELLVWGNRLTTLPPEVARLTALDWLNLHQNQVKALPAEMTALTALTSLDLGQNGLKEVPPVVCRLTSLTSLDLSRNVALPAVPPCLGQLERLEFLGLAFNVALRDLPPELSALRGLKEVTGLEAGFLASPTLAALRAALPATAFSGAAEGALIDRMQKMTAEGDRIRREEEAKKKRRLIR